MEKKLWMKDQKRQINPYIYTLYATFSGVKQHTRPIKIAHKPFSINGMAVAKKKKPEWNQTNALRLFFSFLARIAGI